MPEPQSEVTQLLTEWSRGDPDALERLLPLVFDELRQIARAHMRKEAPGHTLQATALVNEVYVRLVDQRKVSWANRSQFFAFAATLMRRILVDHYKARSALKRGGDAVKLSLDEAIGLPEMPDVDVLALHRALEKLTELDPRQGRIVEMRFFGGLDNAEIAELLDVSVTTVKREWKTAKLWLLREMSR